MELRHIPFGTSRFRHRSDCGEPKSDFFFVMPQKSAQICALPGSGPDAPKINAVAADLQYLMILARAQSHKRTRALLVR